MFTTAAQKRRNHARLVAEHRRAEYRANTWAAPTDPGAWDTIVWADPAATAPRGQEKAGLTAQKGSMAPALPHTR
jgi:hypothetical protein